VGEIEIIKGYSRDRRALKEKQKAGSRKEINAGHYRLIAVTEYEAIHLTAVCS
jgi:hypothetical protein